MTGPGLPRLCPSLLLALTVAVAAPAPLPAQEDATAGLFTAARQLPLVAQSLTVQVRAGEAEVRLVQSFHNPGGDLGQADYHLHLPPGASVTGFGFWSDGKFLRAELKERTAAEARHRQAAAEGRATTLLRRESSIHSFSVYPVAAGETKRIETELRLSIERELGRSHLLLPVDAFLGQSGPASLAWIEVDSEEPIAEFGASGARLQTVERGERTLRLALSTRQAVDLWWTEEGPPLLFRAAAVPLPEGGLAFELRAALNDGRELGSPPARVHILVDASYSMRRRAGALRALLARLAASATVPVDFRLVAGETAERAAAGVVPAILAGELGHVASAQGFTTALAGLDCADPSVRCAIVTDPQLEGLADLAGPAATGVAVVLLGDPHELAHAEGRLPPGALSYQEGVEPEARLLALVDQLVRPVLAVRALRQEGSEVDLPGRQERAVAEGGLLRLSGETRSYAPLEIEAAVDGRRLDRHLDLVVLDPASPEGAAVRRGAYRERLVAWMEAWRRAPDPELKQRIVALSLREGIPTAFTALQVDDPRLSLSAMKPGDPLLTVADAPGLSRVVAWYPFGDLRQLERLPGGDFADRFLVPRGWRQGGYRIEVFRHFEDGRIEAAHVWYVLDEEGPPALISLDAGAGLVTIDTGEATPEVASVTVHGGDGSGRYLSPLGSRWSLPAAELPAEFAVLVRDRAGNRTAFACRLQDGELRVLPRREPGLAPTTALTAPAVQPPLTWSRGRLGVEGGDVVVALERRLYRFPRADAPLRSLDLTASLVVAEDLLLLGTRGGDLVAVDCTGGSCRARLLTLAFAHHPVTGLAALGDGRVLVGVLGLGLRELRDGKIGPSSLDVGTRFVTGLARHRGETLIATGYNGLWRLVGGRAVKTRFPHDHVAGIEAAGAGLEVRSGFGRFLQTGRDRFLRLDDGSDGIAAGSERLTAAATLDGDLYVASFDRGLFRLAEASSAGALALEPVALGLVGLERQVNDVLALGGRLWLATEGGLLEVAPARPAVVGRPLAAAAHDLAADGVRLAVATSAGLFVLDRPGAAPRRVDRQSGAAGRGLAAVAWWQGELYAGGLDGLFRATADGLQPIAAAQGFDSAWVTALLADGERLLVGTYDEGVHALAAGRVAPVPGLARQWVPPQGLARVGKAVWVGGTGMPPARLEGSEVTAVAVPAEDVSAVVPDRDGAVVLLTSAGLVRLAAR